MYKPPTAHASVTSLALLSPPHLAIAAFCPLKWHQVQTLFRFFPSTISRTKNKSQPCEKSAQATALNFHRDTNVCVLCELLKKHTKKKNILQYLLALVRPEASALSLTASTAVWQQQRACDKSHTQGGDMMKLLTLASPTVTQPKVNWWNWRECTDGIKKGFLELFSFTEQNRKRAADY